MTLESTLRKKLAEPLAGRQAVPLEHAGWSVRLDVERGDALSCLLWEVELRRDTPPAGDVTAWAERIAGKVTGLMEPLHVVEVETGRQLALLRSNVPTAKDTGVHYFELRLAGTGAASLRRLVGHPKSGKKSEQIAFALTYETLAKFVEDVAA